MGVIAMRSKQLYKIIVTLNQTVNQLGFARNKRDIKHIENELRQVQQALLDYNKNKIIETGYRTYLTCPKIA